MSEAAQMINVAGVQFRRAGKIYTFDVGSHDVVIGDYVVVETDRGPSLAKIRSLHYAERGTLERNDLKRIIRLASHKDLDSGSRLSPQTAVSMAREKVKALGLEMRVLKAEIQFGGNKVVVYFSAPGRVDFRELVKELAGSYKARIELKQVGARDETKILGGIGVCGREYCCSSFLREFVPVSIRMAKTQNLALNPTKVSGGCGRLLCCLTYENDLYKDLRRNLPGLGTRVRLRETGEEGDVIRTDILNQTVGFETMEGREVSCKASDIEVVSKGRKAAQSSEEWGEDIDLAALEDSGGESSFEEK